MQEGQKLTENLCRRIEQQVRSKLSPRHVPQYIVQVKDIPVTINGKKVEIAVKKIISGAKVKVSSTVANTDSLNEYVKYRDYEERKSSKL
jgi:acetoacetyl-CoA synthetase